LTAEELTLADGARIAIRPIAPEDRDELAAGFERLSPESRYRRFFGPMKELSPRDLDRLTRVDHRDHEALVALDAATGHGVAVARYVRTAPEEAEPAVVVADDWQRRGVASALLERLAARARAEGIVTFRAPVLAQNASAIGLLKRLGESEMTRMGREVELAIDLTPAEAPDRDLFDVLREVAAGALAPGRTLLSALRPRRAGPPDRARLRDTIVVGTDGSEEAAQAVRCAAGLAPALGVSVELVAVHWPLLGDREEMDDVLRADAARLRKLGIEVTTHVRRGDPAASLMDVAAEERARMIVLGPRGRQTPAQVLLGSVSETVAAHAPCDVLIVRERRPG
jgi:nucleotide-binding universal stress UspA family protein/GNAT superfamily N-acetyltransferase